jgi:hypothetical protein
MRLPRPENLVRGDPLAIYLNDHLAGSTVGVELVRRAAANNRSSEYGRALARLANEIEEDRAALEELMSRLGIGRDRLKLLVSWGAEKAGRAKPNGRLVGYSPLSRLEELELLLLGVTGKLAMWRALRLVQADDERLRDVEFDPLIERAESQRRRIERERLKATREALVASARPAAGR